MVTDHIAAIHTLKSKLGMTDDDYRALLRNLTGKASSKDCDQAQRRTMREHLARLAEKMGLATPTRRRPLNDAAFNQAKQQASPRERKVWALWHQLHKDGRIANPSRAALDAWVHGQVQVSSLRFCNAAQLDQLIESLKKWVAR